MSYDISTSFVQMHQFLLTSDSYDEYNDFVDLGYYEYND